MYMYVTQQIVIGERGRDLYTLAFIDYYTIRDSRAPMYKLYSTIDRLRKIVGKV